MVGTAIVSGPLGPYPAIIAVKCFAYLRVFWVLVLLPCCRIFTPASIHFAANTSRNEGNPLTLVREPRKGGLIIAAPR